MNVIKNMVDKLDSQTKKFILESKDFEQHLNEIEDGLQRYMDMVNPAFGHRTKKNCMVTDALFCAISGLITDADRVMSQK